MSAAVQPPSPPKPIACWYDPAPASQESKSVAATLRLTAAISNKPSFEELLARARAAATERAVPSSAPPRVVPQLIAPAGASAWATVLDPTKIALMGAAEPAASIPSPVNPAPATTTDPTPVANAESQQASDTFTDESLFQEVPSFEDHHHQQQQLQQHLPVVDEPNSLLVTTAPAPAATAIAASKPRRAVAGTVSLKTRLAKAMAPRRGSSAPRDAQGSLDTTDFDCSNGHADTMAIVLLSLTTSTAGPKPSGAPLKQIIALTARRLLTKARALFTCTGNMPVA
jgi:hypothetical protein